MKNLNKHRKLFKILPILIFITIFSSCFEDLDDIKPMDKIGEVTVWNDLALVDLFVNQIYTEIQSGHVGYMLFATCSDEAFSREQAGAHLVQRGNITPSNMGNIGNVFMGQPVWNNLWGIVSKCNTFITNMQGEALEKLVEEDKERVDRLFGQVKVLRAWAYHRLIALWGDVPLITTRLSIDQEIDMPRSSYETIVEFIVSDLDEAEDLLPFVWDGNNQGRITKGAALALKSRVLLYAASPLHNPDNNQAKWQAAADAAKAVIDLGIYDLYPDYYEMSTVYGNFSNERIWELVRNNDIWFRDRVEGHLFPPGSQGGAIARPTPRHVDAYETINGLSIHDDPDFDPDNPYINRDPRFHATILHNGAEFRGREIELWEPGGLDAASVPHHSTGYFVRKFVDENWDRPVSYNESSNVNWIMFRYAEILLNYAEANYFLENEDIAREYVDLVRSRPSVMMPAVTDSGENLLARIKNERRIELYMEEHRFFDIRRWKETFPEGDWLMRDSFTKDPDTGIVTVERINLIEWALPEHTYLLPIPQEERLRSPALTQNPGY